MKRFKQSKNPKYPSRAQQHRADRQEAMEAIADLQGVR